MGRSNQRDKLTNLIEAQKKAQQGIRDSAQKLAEEQAKREAEQREQSNPTEEQPPS